MTTEQLKSILIVRTDRIGDVTLSLPIASVIKEKFPNYKVFFLVKAYTQAITRSNSYVDETLVLKEKNNKISLIENLRLLSKYKFDVAIVLYPTFMISLILFLSKIKKRIGTGYRLYSFLFTDRIYEHRKNSIKHDLEYNFSLLKAIGINFNAGIDNVNFNIKLNQNSLRNIENILKSYNIDNNNRFIIIHPGSGGSSIDLPINKFKELINSISNLNIKIILTGSNEEKKICNQLLQNEKVINLAGMLTLDELMALISKSTLIITNSTGPIHLAAALGIYTFGFYPKIPSCSAKRWGPYTNKKFIYEPEIDCYDCNRKQCEKLNCMEYISIDKVVNDIKKILN